jgi:hypothetical protein
VTVKVAPELDMASLIFLAPRTREVEGLLGRTARLRWSCKPFPSRNPIPVRLFGRDLVGRDLGVPAQARA